MIVTFGEIMGRLSPPGFRKLRQAVPGALEVTFAGAEANVAVAIAQLGGAARFVSAVPGNDLGEGCIAAMRAMGVETRWMLRRSEGRLGLYFVETGANQRPSRVLYDRDHSTISLTPGEEYPWEEIFSGASWLHLSGITPALSARAAEATRTAAAAARRAGCTVSCDLNFRKQLWRWKAGVGPGALAAEVMRGILPAVDVLIANEEDAQDVLGIAAEGTDVASGRIDAAKYREVARRIAADFPSLGRVAITLRESRSASHNRWGAMLYEAASGEAHFAPLADGEYRPYEITDMVDRVGGGDAFAGALIFAWNTPDLSGAPSAVAFAAAASCLAHSIPGDFNFTSRAEAEALMRGSAAGRVVR